MKRRTFLKLSSMTAVVLFTGCGDDESNIDQGSADVLAVALPIPTLLHSTQRNGVMHYDLNIVEGNHQFFDGVKTKSYGIDSSYLGPTLLLKNGETVSVNYTNNLKEDTTMHAHGMRLPGTMDGSAHQVIKVGKTWSAQYTVNQNACTNWYHPHYMGKTAEHVYEGLAGIIIVEDSESSALDLPNRYGVDDIPLVLQDRKFSADRTEMDYSPTNMELSRGYIGETFIVNGAIAPTFDAEAKEIRFRLLNGSNSTMYELGFNENISFKQIASDNGLLEAPVSMSRLLLSPGERAEIVVDFTDAAAESFTLKEFRHDKTFMTINVKDTATAVTTLPDTLASLEPVATPVRSRRFELDMAGMGRFTINNKVMDLNRIDANLNQGEAEEWEVVNKMNVDHNFHVHGSHFRVVSRNNNTAAVKKSEQGYKDVVHIPPNESVKIIVQINDVTADANAPFMFHCHFLEHEDHGMMGQFTVS